MNKQQEKLLVEKVIRPLVRKVLRENYSFLLKGSNDFYKLKSFFSASTPEDLNNALIQDATFMKMCQNIVSYLKKNDTQ